MTRTLVAALVLTTSSAVALAGGLPATASDAAPAASHHQASKPSRVKLTVQVSGCDTCTVQPISIGPGDNYWSTDKKTVSGGRVTFRVPARRTSGMALMVTEPGPDAFILDAEPYVVMRYEDLPVGRKVTDALASFQDSGLGCWAGTRQKSATLKVVVARRTVTDPRTGSTGQAILPFLERGVHTVGTANPTTHGGVLATQDRFTVCGDG